MTIAFNYLGRMGRLGNQMFQYSALRGISKNRGFDFSFPVYNQYVDDGIGNKVKTELFDCFEMVSVGENNIRILNTNNYIDEETFSFNEKLFNKCPDNVSIIGYFQTEKYFKNVEDEIKKDFTFKKYILKPCQEMFSSLETDKVVSLHVRRGDYLINPDNHPVCGLYYYENALMYFDDYDKILVFSDDPEWCNNQKIFSDDKFLIAEGNNNYVDLCLMTFCSGHIIANSSFSWWGAWLSESKKVIAPKKWFGPALEHKDTKDVYPEGWIKI